jgi:TRAP-type mannitol/chloroaromatic compound transport system permease small subunit
VKAAMRGYVRVVDGFNRGLGRIVMYGLFAMIGVLLWSSISKTFFTPSQWTLEVAQFGLVAYFMLGGPYALLVGANVRMDLFYHDWSNRRKAQIDAMTVFFLLFYLAVLLYGALDSLAYGLGHFQGEPIRYLRGLVWTWVTQGHDAAAELIGFVERSSTAWRPVMWPVKLIMATGVFLMLLQAISELFKDILKATERRV